MSTFGNTEIGAFTGEFNVNKWRAALYKKPEGGKVSKLTLYVAPGSSAAAKAKIKAVIYANSGGEAGALLVEGTEVIYTQTEVAKWLDLPLAAELELVTGEYWIGILFGGEEHALTFHYSEGTENQDAVHNHTYAEGAPNPAGEQGKDNHVLSLYATYTSNPPSLTKPAATTVSKGVPINEIAVKGENGTAWSATSLPAGLAISATTGVISGTPTTVEAPTVKVKLKGTGGEAETSFTLTVVSVATAATYQGYTAFSPFPLATLLGSATCAFNRPVGQSRVLSNSAAMTSWLLNDVSGYSTIHPQKNEGFATVYPKNTDPQIEILDEDKGFYDKKTIRIPAAAEAQKNEDKHLQVVLCPSDCTALSVPEGTTADFWRVGGAAWCKANPTNTTIHYEGAKLAVSSSGKGNMTGSLVGGDAIAANFDLNAGIIRAPGAKAGEINHALQCIVHNCKNSFVTPATHSDGEENGLPPTPSFAPAMGQRFFFEITTAEIEAAKLPKWEEAYAKALATYGFYIADTGNPTLSFRFEASNMYTAFSATDMWQRVGEEQGLPTEAGLYSFPLGNVFSLWKTRLRAVAAPATEGAEQPALNTIGSQSSTTVTSVALATGGTHITSFGAEGLPSGLSIDSSTGKITGTPSGVHSGTVTVFGAGNGTEVQTSFQWTVTQAPAQGQFAANFIERLQPWNQVPPKSLTATEVLATAAAKPFETILEVCEEDGSQGETGWVPAWGKLFNPEECPERFLPYLAMYVGVALPKVATEGEARELIKNEAGLARGTLKSLEGAIERVTGERKESFFIEERTNLVPEAAPYFFLVFVKVGKISQALYEAINAATPAGLWYEIIELSGVWLEATKAWEEESEAITWENVNPEEF